MARPSITPRAHERPFAAHELFFSTTDRKGLIRSCNQVFVRVSAHPVEALLGAPHNIIRHPDMPKAVFHLMWSYLEQARPFAGYVKNMAADGAYYWVLALVVPIEGGFLSVRLKPSSDLLPVVQGLYAELLAIERAAGTEGGAWRRGMEAATTRLHQAIAGLGYSSYDDFMRAAAATELTGFRAASRAIERATAADLGAFAASAEACRGVERGLDDLFSRVDRLLGTIDQLGKAARFVHDLAGDIHLISLNALVGSCRLQQGGERLSVVTEDLAHLSQHCTEHVQGMSTRLRELAGLLGDTAFAVTAARLQSAMTADFIRELARERQAAPDAALDSRLVGDLRTLAVSLGGSTASLVATLPKAQAPIPGLRRLQHELESDLRRLSSVYLIGAIQAVGIPEASMFRELLDRIVGQLERSSAELAQLSEGVENLRTHLPEFERTAHGARRATQVLHQAALAA